MGTTPLASLETCTDARCSGAPSTYASFRKTVRLPSSHTYVQPCARLRWESSAPSLHPLTFPARVRGYGPKPSAPGRCNLGCPSLRAEGTDAPSIFTPAGTHSPMQPSIPAPYGCLGFHSEVTDWWPVCDLREPFGVATSSFTALDSPMPLELNLRLLRQDGVPRSPLEAPCLRLESCGHLDPVNHCSRRLEIRLTPFVGLAINTSICISEARALLFYESPSRCRYGTDWRSPNAGHLRIGSRELWVVDVAPQVGEHE